MNKLPSSRLLCPPPLPPNRPRGPAPACVAVSEHDGAGPIGKGSVSLDACRARSQRPASLRRLPGLITPIVSVIAERGLTRSVQLPRRRQVAVLRAAARRPRAGRRRRRPAVESAGKITRAPTQNVERSSRPRTWPLPDSARATKSARRRSAIEARPKLQALFYEYRRALSARSRPAPSTRRTSSRNTRTAGAPRTKRPTTLRLARDLYDSRSTGCPIARPGRRQALLLTKP